MKKSYSATLELSATDPNVIAEVGAFADALEQKYGTALTHMSVCTTARGNNVVRIGSFPPIRPADFAPQEPPAPEPKAKKGRVKPEIREPEVEVSIPVADLAPETVAELERMAEEAEAAEAKPELTAHELTRDDGFSALRSLIDSHGNDAAKRALAKLGHVKFSDVPTNRMAELLEAVAEQAK